jgi:hypothetical protein
MIIISYYRLVTPHSKLEFKAMNKFQIKSDAVLGQYMLDLYPLLKRNNGKCEYSINVLFLLIVTNLGQKLPVLTTEINIAELYLLVIQSCKYKRFWKNC